LDFMKASGSLPPGHVRIIGGAFKRSHLSVPDFPGLRPTPDRVRQTLFDWLGADLSEWRCVDAFAGTGALGFEAASRGASQVMMFEKSSKLCSLLQANKNKLKAQAVQIYTTDAVMKLTSLPAASIDLIFLDPPFELASSEATPKPDAFKDFDTAPFDRALQAAAHCCVDSGWIYLEAPKAWPESALLATGLRTHRYLKAGAVHAHLLQKLVP
jgi:16S rRNA (guanine966-N2)-methyltransferase